MKYLIILNYITILLTVCSSFSTQQHYYGSLLLQKKHHHHPPPIFSHSSSLFSVISTDNDVVERNSNGDAEDDSQSRSLKSMIQTIASLKNPRNYNSISHLLEFIISNHHNHHHDDSIEESNGDHPVQVKKKKENNNEKDELNKKEKIISFQKVLQTTDISPNVLAIALRRIIDIHEEEIKTDNNGKDLLFDWTVPILVDTISQSITTTTDGIDITRIPLNNHGIADFIHSLGRLILLQQQETRRSNEQYDIIKQEKLISILQNVCYFILQDNNNLSQHHQASSTHSSFVSEIGPQRLVSTLSSFNIFLSTIIDNKDITTGTLLTNNMMNEIQTQILNRLIMGDAISKLSLGNISSILQHLTFVQTREREKIMETTTTTKETDNTNNNNNLLMMKSLMRRLRKQKVRNSIFALEKKKNNNISGDPIVEHQLSHLIKSYKTIAIFMDTYGDDDTTDDESLLLLFKEAQIMSHTLLKMLLQPLPQHHLNTTLFQSLTTKQISDVLYGYSIISSLPLQQQQPTSNKNDNGEHNSSSYKLDDDIANQIKFYFDSPSYTHHITDENDTVSIMRDISQIFLSFQRLWYNDYIDCISTLTTQFQNITLQTMASTLDCDKDYNTNQRKLILRKSLVTVLRSMSLLLFLPSNKNPTTDNNNYGDKEEDDETKKIQSIFDTMLNTTKSVLLLVENKKSTGEASSYCTLPSNILLSLSDYEASNIIWFMAKTKSYDEALLCHLSNHILDSRILSKCTLTSASRFLWSYTMLTTTTTKRAPTTTEENYRKSTEQIFDKLLNRMIYENTNNLKKKKSNNSNNNDNEKSSRDINTSLLLTPTDTSATMWAMAQNSHIYLDLAKFDYFAKNMISFTTSSSSSSSHQKMKKAASTKELSQCLWSCAKMVSWEILPTTTPPPASPTSSSSYINCAKQFAHELVLQKDLLSAKDVSRSIWSMGKLYESFIFYSGSSDNSNIIVSEEKKKDDILKMVHSLAIEAYHKKHLFNSHELASILWGLSKMSYHKSSSFHSSSIIKHPYSQQQSSKEDDDYYYYDYNKEERNNDNMLDGSTIIESLIQEILSSPFFLQECSSQSASNILLALGRMEISSFSYSSDVKKIFKQMSIVIMNKLSESTPQGIGKFFSHWYNTI